MRPSLRPSRARAEDVIRNASRRPAVPEVRRPTAGRACERFVRRSRSRDGSSPTTRFVPSLHRNRPLACFAEG